MIRIIKDIPKDVVVACSGGTDSMVILDFLKMKVMNVTSNSSQIMMKYTPNYNLYVPYIFTHLVDPMP